VDAGFNLISVILRSDDGSMDIRTTLAVDPKVAVHSCVLWLLGTDDLLLNRGEPTWLLVTQLAYADRLAVAQYDPHPLLSHRPTGLPHMVLDQLLPRRIKRPSARDDVRRPQSCGVDDWLKYATLR
jgi:hypothetical protein